MFSDTHFHFRLMAQEFGVDGQKVLEKMALNNCFFGLDIGTKADDLFYRQESVEKHIAQITDYSLAERIRKCLYFSAGIWPSVEEIKDRHNRMKLLRTFIEKANESSDQDILNRKVIAIGECGLDHHWNINNADKRNEQDFNEEIYKGEAELFESQLELAKELKLPVIIHSRDAFEETLDCIKNVSYDNGLIHCYSYGLEEAKAFLNRGWYIAFGGATTYTKKSKMEDLKLLINYIPEDRILLETDSPYLSPVPLRGTPNSPVNVELVYKFVSEIRNISPEKLSDLVDQNIKNLFF